MPDEVPWQVEEFVPDGETVVYADRAVLKRPWLKVRYYGWVALTERAFHFRGKTVRKEWVFPPTPTRWKEKHVPYDRFEEIARADRSRAEIRDGGRYYFWVERKDDEQTAHWHRRQSRFIRRLRKRASQADHGTKDALYPFFRKVEMPPHKAMNPRQARKALEDGGWKAERHGVIWDEDEVPDGEE